MRPERAEVGGLVVCPTPIGNLTDVTLRTLEWMHRAELLACEDTRRTRLLLERHGVERPAGALISFHEHNEGSRTRELLARMRAGATVALVSDAGMPLISDPGHRLVAGALREGLGVTVLPGASAVTTAIVASGLPAAEFRFVGFLPRRQGELSRLLAENSETLVAFESPRRLPSTLALLAGIDPQRPVAVCRELTKLHEQVLRASAAELAEHFAGEAPRGELALVVGAAARAPAAEREALAALRELVAAGARARPAAAVVARLTGARANELYRGLTEKPRRPGRDERKGSGRPPGAGQ
jgi:16S rRNA (cytidine1402-2'-O)-methyltransferase